MRVGLVILFDNRRTGPPPPPSSSRRTDRETGTSAAGLCAVVGILHVLVYLPVVVVHVVVNFVVIIQTIKMKKRKIACCKLAGREQHGEFKRKTSFPRHQDCY